MDLEQDSYVFPGERFSQSGVIIGNGKGMTLRDWFAGQYIAGRFGGEPGIHLRPENAARDAYELADAMLAARAKPPATP
ncbi:hypothetical protein AN189_17485 [Loktanella sp. 3ANDIMAR09]|uniref:hypothetical protein n=1 Tax=Loktanella sp. 3ANDIMAR09 TaxID=1225657 RepID=UPI0006FBC333|nr:hypothetical protein [Loktanella sp. 3ANDIMAR09]KQI67018.1 hypothetical protein AN189_17485 [Loktanella sp. 3ANDIMAR09]